MIVTPLQKTFDQVFHLFAKIYYNPFLSVAQSETLRTCGQSNRIFLSQSDFWMMQANLIHEEFSLTQTGTIFSKKK